MSWFTRNDNAVKSMTAKQFVEGVARVLVLEYKFHPDRALQLVTENWSGDDFAEHDREGLSRIYKHAVENGYWRSAVHDAAHTLMASMYAHDLREMKGTIDNVRHLMVADGLKDEEIRILLRDATPMFLKAKQFPWYGDGDVEDAIYGAIKAMNRPTRGSVQ